MLNTIFVIISGYNLYVCHYGSLDPTIGWCGCILSLTFVTLKCPLTQELESYGLDTGSSRVWPREH
jgi:hypothetical protein